MNLDTNTRQALINEAEQLKGILAEAHVSLWVEKIDHAIRLLEADHFKDAVDEILGFYGGMGSLNDLVVSPVNGHDVSEEKGKELTQYLQEHGDRLQKLVLEAMGNG